MTNYMEEFRRCFRQLARQHDGSRVFADFVEAAAISLRQPIYQNPEEEKRYMDIIKPYTREQVNLLPELLGITVVALEKKPHDFLGTVFQSLELNSRELAQYFTPGCICKLIGSCLFSKEKVEQCIRQKGYVTLSDPACGSGGMLIEVIRSFRELGFNPHTQLLIDANDVSHVAVCMVYIQLTLLGAAAVISRRNTITQQNFYTYHTPVFFWENWPERQKDGHILESIQRLMSFPAATVAQPSAEQPARRPETPLAQPLPDMSVKAYGQLEFNF